MRLKKIFCLGLSCFMLMNLSFGVTLSGTSKFVKKPIKVIIEDELIILRPIDGGMKPGIPAPIPVPKDPTLKVM